VFKIDKKGLKRLSLNTNMSIVNFNNLKVTTMTVIVNLEGDAFIESAFPLLPITRLDLSKTNTSKKKFKIPWPGKEYAGKIFSVKFQGKTRGIVKSSSGKSFRNSVAVEICTSGKNISAKLVKNKIHMCGPTSRELAMETAEHIINHLYSLQQDLNYIHSHTKELNTVINWLENECKGEEYIINEETQEIIDLHETDYILNNVVYDSEGNVRYVFKETEFKWLQGDTINSENVIMDKHGHPYYRNLTNREKKDGLRDYPLMIIGENLVIPNEGDRVPTDLRGKKYKKVIRVPLRVRKVTSVKFPDCFHKGVEGDNITYPEHVDQKIADFLIKYGQDYAYHSTFMDFLKSVKNLKQVCTPNLGIKDMNIAMINYSYTLKMNINRRKLSQLIDGYDGFDARYDNTTDHHVTITLPYELPEGFESIKRKNKNLCHTFMVYKSGIVTQSGPLPEIMEGAYYKFMGFIESVRDQIRLKSDKPFGIKYKPTSSEDYLRKALKVH